jgi:hypothetical protein
MKASTPITAEMMRRAWSLAGRIVSEARAKAPAGFDPKAEAAEAEEAPPGIEADAELMDGVFARLGVSGGSGGTDRGERGEGRGESGGKGEKAAAKAGAAAAPAKGEKAEEKDDEEETEDEADKGSERSDEEKKEEAEEVTIELSPDQEAYVLQQVEGATAEFKEKLTAAEQRVAELEEQLQAPARQASERIHPLLLETDPAKIEETEKAYRAFESWATKHWDGYEAKREGEASYTAEEVRERYNEIKQQREELVPKAKQLVQQRALYTGAAEKVYPQLFDKRSPEHKVAQHILRECPELNQFPNVMILIGDAIEGEKVRIAKVKAEQAAAAAKGDGKGGKKFVLKKAAPKVPAGGGSGRSQVPAVKTAAKGAAMNVTSFVKRGGDRDALVHTIMEANIV